MGTRVTREERAESVIFEESCFQSQSLITNPRLLILGVDKVLFVAYIPTHLCIFKIYFEKKQCSDLKFIC